MLASSIVWLDAFTSNVDRTPRNANMLMWHRKLWLIDHGAALYFHHGWGDGADRSASPFAAIKDHVLLKFASALDAADAAMTARITPALIQEVVALVPDAWLASDKAFASAELAREAYVQHLSRPSCRRHAHFSRRPSVHAQCSYDYAVIRVVPRVERQEFINAGVILWCQEQDVLEARIELDEARLRMLDGVGRSRCRAAAPCELLDHLRGRERRRTDRQTSQTRALRLAGSSAKHDHPDLRGS